MRLDDDTYLDNSSSHSIGEIKLAIDHVIEPKLSVKHNHHDPPHLQKVHERSKKAIAHRVKYVTVSPNIDA